MKITPRSLIAAKELTLPSGLTVTALGSPNLMKLVNAGKLPAPLAQKAFDVFSAADAQDFKPSFDALKTMTEYQAAVVCAVVDYVHYVDGDDEGTVYNLPLTLDANSDDCYPYDLLSQEDSDYIFAYAQEGVEPLATFPPDAEGTGSGDGSGQAEGTPKRTTRAKK